jgi:hypothetical protein
MDEYANIQRYTLETGDIIAVSGGIGYGRMILRFTADTRMSMSEGELDFNYMMFQADTVIILDPPNLLATNNIWFRLDSAATGVVEILRC